MTSYDILPGCPLHGGNPHTFCAESGLGALEGTKEGDWVSLYHARSLVNVWTTLEGFSDADWASQPHCHSISGYAFQMGKGIITWSSKKQSVVVLSSTKSEYIAQMHATKKLMWLHVFLGELTTPFIEPTTLHCDNQGAIVLSKDNKFHACTKHINIRYHYICEAIENKNIILPYIPTEDNIADIFTKALSKPKFKKLLGLGSPSFPSSPSLRNPVTFSHDASFICFLLFPQPSTATVQFGTHQTLLFLGAIAFKLCI